MYYGYNQAFNQDLKRGCPKCAMGPAQMRTISDKATYEN